MTGSHPLTALYSQAQLTTRHVIAKTLCGLHQNTLALHLQWQLESKLLLVLYQSAVDQLPATHVKQ